jgi:hypothetical protein
MCVISHTNVQAKLAEKNANKPRFFGAILDFATETSLEQPAGYADFPWISKAAIVPSAGEQSEIDLGSRMPLRICGRLFKLVGATR